MAPWVAASTCCPCRQRRQRAIPELCVIDLAQGKVQSHIPTKNGEALGNLVLAQGVLLSQTPLAVAAFPDRAALREQINERLKADPKDAVALGNRACMRLDEGNLAGGIDDLRAALGNKPEEKERLRFECRLFDALLGYYCSATGRLARNSWTTTAPWPTSPFPRTRPPMRRSSCRRNGSGAGC